jgi:hypothetical protein
MIEHPWTELQVLIKEKWLTQKAFSLILWKKVSEVNELLKWKRNITIQRDYLLHQTLWTPIKYWILKQVDYDYSLIDIDEENSNNNPGSASMTDQDWNKESMDASTSFWTQWRIQENAEQVDSSTHKWVSEWQIETQTESQEIPIQEPDPKDDEDFKKRAKIFKSF